MCLSCIRIVAEKDGFHRDIIILHDDASCVTSCRSESAGRQKTDYLTEISSAPVSSLLFFDVSLGSFPDTVPVPLFLETFLVID